MQTREVILPSPHGKELDARRTIRYMLHARVVFHWTDTEGSQKVGRGHTRNLSQKGAYVVSLEHPPTGAHVSLTIYLPALGVETRLLSLTAQGHVTRVDSNLLEKQEGKTGFGFAVSNHQVMLCTS